MLTDILLAEGLKCGDREERLSIVWTPSVRCGPSHRTHIPLIVASTGQQYVDIVQQPTEQC